MYLYLINVSTQDATGLSKRHHIDVRNQCPRFREKSRHLIILVGKFAATRNEIRTRRSILKAPAKNSIFAHRLVDTPLRQDIVAT